MAGGVIETEPPFEVNLSKNPIAFLASLAFAARSYIENFGVPAVRHLEFTSDPSIFDKLVLSWDDKEVELEARTNPNFGEGDQFTSGVIGPPLLTQIAKDFARNLLLTDDFIFEFDAGFPNSVKITARRVGINLDMLSVSTGFTSVMNTIDAGEDREGTIDNNHFVTFRINIEEEYLTNEYTRLPEISLKANPFTEGVVIVLPIPSVSDSFKLRPSCE